MAVIMDRRMGSWMMTAKKWMRFSWSTLMSAYAQPRSSLRSFAMAKCQSAQLSQADVRTAA